MTEAEFIDALKEFDINLTKEQLHLLNRYYELLVEWNQRINLTGITEKKAVFLKHFYDSLTLSKVVDFASITSVCDVGTGAGFPGLVIKIVFPELKVTLVDSLRKRTEFLKIVIQELGLKDVCVINTRAEDLKNREMYDLVTARAVAPLNILLELLVPLAKKYVVVQKGDATSELVKTERLYQELGISLVNKCEFLLPIENSKRTILKYCKLHKTNLKYPRRYDKIKKDPL